MPHAPLARPCREAHLDDDLQPYPPDGSVWPITGGEQGDRRRGGHRLTEFREVEQFPNGEARAGDARVMEIPNRVSEAKG